MASNHFANSMLLTAGVLLVGACATKPVVPLEEKYFQREASHYQKFQQEDGQTIYCQSDARAASLIPHKWCITEANLRLRVEDARRSRNPVVRGGPPYVATVPGGG